MHKKSKCVEQKPPFRSAYTPSDRSGQLTCDQHLTEQAHRQACDVNQILSTYRRTGLVEHVNTYKGDYSDISDVPTYHQALEQIRSAEYAFNTLTAEIRDKFRNDPGLFLNFVNDPNNREEMGRMGLLHDKWLPEPDPKPQPTPEAPISSPDE